MNKIIKYVLTDILRSKSILAFTALLFVLSISIFSIESQPDKGVVSLLNIVLFVVPLISIIFSTIYLYNSLEFIELLVSQPLRRQTIWLSVFLGLSGAITLSFFVGVGIPVLIFSSSVAGIMLILCGCALCIIFVAIALWSSIRIRDKAKGIGLAILLWLYFAVLFDALILFLLFQFADYPIESTMVAVSMLNPIDLSRILILLEVDISAMMGYTGAIFKNFFGTTGGMFITSAVMLCWFIIPLLLSTHFFKKKDL